MSFNNRFFKVVLTFPLSLSLSSFLIWIISLTVFKLHNYNVKILKAYCTSIQTMKKISIPHPSCFFFLGKAYLLQDKVLIAFQISFYSHIPWYVCTAYHPPHVLNRITRTWYETRNISSIRIHVIQWWAIATEAFWTVVQPCVVVPKILTILKTFIDSHVKGGVVVCRLERFRVEAADIMHICSIERKPWDFRDNVNQPLVHSV